TFEPDGINEGVARGGYIISDCEGEPQALVMSTGTEVAIALEAQQQLATGGIRVRVISLPCFELFNAQDAAYKAGVLPPNIRARVAVEAGNRQSWDQYLGLDGGFVGIEGRYGASAPGEVIYEKLGLTPEAVIKAVKALLS
ncbi:MAG TPA: transketolase C-terminal domain-containing protein, partial [Aggregatilineales bacterium]|nr:transketolase C-terminal domain-containing protein [Aggregatilineales bacterium]